VSVTVPQLAVTEPATLIFQMLTPGNAQFAGHLYADYAFQILTVAGGERTAAYQFSGPVMVEIRYTDDRIAGIDELSLKLACRAAASEAWVPCDTGGVPTELKPALNTIRVATFETGQFALFGRKNVSQRIFLPLMQK
jgi:hypothetical protein